MADFNFSIDSKIPELKRATQEAITTALEAVGVQAVAHANQEITAVGAVDTGRLRNSITSAVSGQTQYISEQMWNTLHMSNLAPTRCERGHS